MGDLSRGEVLSGRMNGIAPMTGSKGHREKLKELLAIPGLWRQVHAALALSLAGFLAGTVEGWPGSISLEGLALSDGNGKITRVGPREISVIFILMVLSAMVHMMMTGALLDRFGRRVGCWFLNCLTPSGWVFLITARSVYQLYLGATLIGTIGMSGQNVGVIFLSEISNERLRGPLISLFMFFNSLGIFASHILIAELDFETFHMICLGINLLFPFFFWRLPETPAFLMKKSRIEDARESVAWYHGNKPEVVDSEMQKLKNSGLVCLHFTNVLGDPRNRKAVKIVVGLFILTELIGTSMVEVFAATTISMITRPRKMKAKTASLILASCRFFGGILNVFFVERSGRKSTMTMSLWFMALFIGGLFIFLSGIKLLPLISKPLQRQEADIYMLSSFPISLVCFALYTLANQMFLATTDVLSGELLTSDTKGAAMALAGFSRILTLVLCVASYNYILTFDCLGTWSFLMYSGFCVLGAILGYRFIPETQGKTLNEIHSDLCEPDTVPSHSTKSVFI